MKEENTKAENSVMEGIKAGTAASITAATAWVGLMKFPGVPEPIYNAIPEHTIVEAAVAVACIGVLVGTAKAAHHHITHASHAGKVAEEKEVAISANA